MLTRQDFDTLMEALEAWERVSFSDTAVLSMIGSVMARSASPIEAELIRADIANDRRKAEETMKLRKESSVMLRAKLLQLRDSLDAEAALEASKTH